MGIVCEIKSFVASTFDMKVMDEASMILDVKIIRNGDGTILSQEHYIEKLQKKFRHFDSMLIPYDANSHLKKKR